MSTTKEIKTYEIKRIKRPGSVKKLTLLPLIDFYAAKENLFTEAGVSYFIQADNTKVLMDVGFNKNKEHPSPLLKNMKTLKVKAENLDFIYISHLHLDHLGGMKEQKSKTFSLSQGNVQLPDIPLYAPEKLSASKWNPLENIIVNDKVFKIKNGIFSMGAFERKLFLMGSIKEQNLVFNVNGKGLVLVVGCGHQTIEKIIERAKILFKEPIYAVIGGLHYPVKGGRINLGPVNLQALVGTENPFKKGIKEKDVFQAIEVIKAENPKIVSLSAHDSSDWTLTQFKKAFGKAYRELLVGKKIII